MNKLILTIALFLLSPITWAKNIPFDLDNHKKLAKFAERTVMQSMAKFVTCTTPHGQKYCFGYSREEESKKIYLAITTLGEGKDDIFTESLINLSMTRMENDSYNLLRYYVFHRGKKMIKRLSKMSPEKIVAHCHAVFHDLQQKEIKCYSYSTMWGVIDLKVDDLCFDTGQADSTRGEIIYEIKTGDLTFDEI